MQAASTSTSRERVNIAVYHAILENSKATGHHLALLLVLAKWADNKGECFPSVPTLAKYCHCSVRTIQRLVVELVANRELQVEKGGGSHKATNLYRILAVRGPVTYLSPVTLLSPVTKRARTGDKSGKRRVTTVSPKEALEESVKKKTRARAKGKPRTLWPAEQPDVSNPWPAILAELRKTTDVQTFNTWYRATRFVAVRGCHLIVGVPNTLFAEWHDHETPYTWAAAQRAGFTDIKQLHFQVVDDWQSLDKPKARAASP
jgi:hypothetical protein